MTRTSNRMFTFARLFLFLSHAHSVLLFILNVMFGYQGTCFQVSLLSLHSLSPLPRNPLFFIIVSLLYFCFVFFTFQFSLYDYDSHYFWATSQSVYHRLFTNVFVCLLILVHLDELFKILIFFSIFCYSFSCFAPKNLFVNSRRTAGGPFVPLFDRR